MGGVQMRNSPGLTMATVPNFTAVGEVAGLAWDNSLVYNLGASRFALGLESGFSYWIYTRDYRRGSLKKGGDGLATQYTASMAPVVKYNVNDALNLNASIGLAFYNPRLAQDETVWWSRTATLRLGLGYAIGRDVYFAPYLQGYLTHLAADATSINLMTVFSVL
jgi:hypothetical protein